MKILKKLSGKGWILAAVACAAAFLLLSAEFYENKVQNMRAAHTVNDTVVGECLENVTIEQTLVIPPTANRLTLLMATYRNELTGQLNIKLVHYPENTLIQEWTVPNAMIPDNQFYPLELKDDFSSGSKDDRYAIIIQGDSLCKPGSSPTIWQSSTDTYPAGALYINGNEVWGDLCFEIYYESPQMVGLYRLVIGILFFLLIGSFFVFRKFGCSIEKVFVLYVLILGIAYMIVFPAESAPDEDRHILTAYNMSNRFLGGPEPEESLVYFRVEDLTGLYGEIPNAESYVSLYANLGKERQNGDYVLVTDEFMIQTPFWTYLPQAMGISFGRVLNCNGTVTILLGRLFSLLFFVGVTCFAIKIIPFGKKILFAVCLLPMTLELVASYSYDTMILALSFLYIALMCRLIFEKEALAIKDIVFPTIVFSLLAPLKYVYTPLILLSLLLPGEKYKTKKEKWISVGILLGSAFLVWISLRGGEPIYVPGYATVEYRTLGYCLQNVTEVIGVYWNTVLQSLPYYLSTMVGMSLGWLELHMPQEVLPLSVLMLFLATIHTDSQSRTLVKTKHYAAFFLCFACVFFLTLTAMLLTWTPISSQYIEGVQGRYFLPVLPLLLLCVEKMDIRSAKNMVKPMVCVGFWINTICLWQGFLIIASR